MKVRLVGGTKDRQVVTLVAGCAFQSVKTGEVWARPARMIFGEDLVEEWPLVRSKDDGDQE